MLSNVPSRMSMTATLAPSLASRSTRTAPRPDAPPVTTTSWSVQMTLGGRRNQRTGERMIRVRWAIRPDEKLTSSLSVSVCGREGESCQVKEEDVRSPTTVQT